MSSLYPTILVAVLSVSNLLNTVNAQRASDTLKTRTLDPVVVEGRRPITTETLSAVHGTYLLVGRRSEVVQPSMLDANIAEKNARQILARIPGLFVYDMDGTGNQLNVATRGLDPHRSWENNVRQNGVLTNSDMYGYPASHYSPPTESIERIEFVRGTASLQYGAQFGGMLNAITKGADTTRRFGLESINSVGSYGLRSTYNALGGRRGRWTYYGYAYWRHSDGYRQNGSTNAQAQFFSIHYRATKRLGFTAEVGHSAYIYHLPGPLTDSMFAQNPRQSTRSRNYFNPDIWVPSVRMDWQLSDRTRLQATVSAVLGARNSVLLDAFATVPDMPDPQTGQYKPRQVDKDGFNSYTAELRVLHRYRVGSVSATLAGGVQLMHNNLHRQQLGKGTSGSDFDLSVVAAFGRDLTYRTANVAGFIESGFQLTPRLTISPGLRIEDGLTQMRGTISYYDPGNLPNDIAHRFALLGLNAEYRPNGQIRLYGGWSQAYRPVIFKDIIPASAYERVDKNLRDASGYNAEVGLEGRWAGFHLNVGLFEVLYRNRLGSLALTDGTTGEAYIFRTTIGDSRNRGVEALLEGPLGQIGRVVLSGFTSTAYLDARYLNGQVSAGTDNRTISGNQVESAPRWTSRNGLTLRYRTLSLTAQFSYVSETYSDALNTPVPSANGAKGPVPAYSLWDLNATARPTSWLTLRGSVNNLLNQQYFTKRPLFYPGPGVWPSDGRSAVLTVGIRI